MDVGGGLVLRCGSGDFATQGTTAVSVRHHDIRLNAEAPASGETNWASGTVLRQVYLGSHRDYLVGLGNGEEVRMVADAGTAIPQGHPVWLHFPPEHCRAVAH